MKKILFRALIIGLLIVVVACIGGLGNYLLTFLLPPRVFVLIGIVIVIVLLKILFELKNRREDK